MSLTFFSLKLLRSVVTTRPKSNVRKNERPFLVDSDYLVNVPATHCKFEQKSWAYF
jgi:hypothetical protein